MNTDRKKRIISDAKSALYDVDKFRQELEETEEIGRAQELMGENDSSISDDLHEVRNRIEDLIKRLTEALEGVKGELRDPSGTGISLAALANELKSQIDWLEGLLKRIQVSISSRYTPGINDFRAELLCSVNSSLKRIREYLLPRIKRLLSKIWQLIANLLTPKEWKLHGKIGTSLLGLADAGIEITFGQ